MSHATSGRETASQMRVRREGRCCHCPEEDALVDLVGREEELRRPSLPLEKVRFVGEPVSIASSSVLVVPCLEGDSEGGGKVLGWLRVETMVEIKRILNLRMLAISTETGNLSFSYPVRNVRTRARGAGCCRRLAPMMRRQFEFLAARAITSTLHLLAFQ